MKGLRAVAAMLALVAVAGCNISVSSGGSRPPEEPPPENSPPATLTSGVQTVMSQGVMRSFYLRVPTNYSPMGTPKPILVAFHGTDGNHERWLPGGLYDSRLFDVIGDEAIIVLPDATPVGQPQVRQFSRDSDGQFFVDLLDYIQQDLGYDPNRVFVAGQSSGAGFANELGCAYGDIIRAIAPNAGALLSNRCVGATAVMLMAGENDLFVPLSIVNPTHAFWVAYNGFDLNVSAPTAFGPCVDHSLGASLYPMLWCLHPGEGFNNHNWPSFATQSMWDFFSSLPQATPGADEPPGGGNDRIAAEIPNTLNVTLDFAAGIGPVYRMVVALYQAGWRPGDFSAPIFFMNLDVAFDPVVPGSQQQLVIPVNMPPDSPPTFGYPKDYVMVFSVYVVGGSYPIPQAGIDHFGFVEMELTDGTTPIVIPEPVAIDPYP